MQPDFKPLVAWQFLEIGSAYLIAGLQVTWSAFSNLAAEQPGNAVVSIVFDNFLLIAEVLLDYCKFVSLISQRTSILVDTIPREYLNIDDCTGHA